MLRRRLDALLDDVSDERRDVVTLVLREHVTTVDSADLGDTTPWYSSFGGERKLSALLSR